MAKFIVKYIAWMDDKFTSSPTLLAFLVPILYGEDLNAKKPDQTDRLNRSKGIF